MYVKTNIQASSVAARKRPGARGPLVVSGILLVAVSLCLVAASAADEITGLAFLKIGVGARAIAMGSAQVALVSDATALYWNPAGLAKLDGMSLHLSHNEWFQDIRQEFLAVATRLGNHGIGASFSGLYMDELPRYDEYGNFLGHFGFYDIAVTAGWGMNVNPEASVGASVKFLLEQIDDETATGFALDVAGRYETPLPNLSIGAGVFNIGPDMKFVAEDFSIPRTVTFGAAYALPLAEWESDLVVATDVVSYRGEDAKLHVGAEYKFRGMASIAAGYKFGHDVEGLSAGVGFSKGTLSIGYAYSALDSDLGDAHRISLSYSLM
jgi:long-subunit fatty acid transport protein